MKKLKVLELFSGSGYISDTFRSFGHKAWKVDNSKDLDANLHIGIEHLYTPDVEALCNGRPDIIWASPDCRTYSIAATAKGGGFIHRELGTYAPKTSYARFCDDVDKHVFRLIKELKPRYWFVENPRGMFRHVHGEALEKLGGKRYTINYCCYGGQLMKPTDIWTNHPNPNFKPRCGSNNHQKGACHYLQPTIFNKINGEGMYSRPIMRGLMPNEFIEHLVRICEKPLDKSKPV
jgi:hypothetical protein